MEPYQYILQELLKLPDSKTTSDPDQIRIRCPICNHNSSNLCVGLIRNTKILGYDCKHNCTFSGKVDKNFLELFNIDCPEYLKDIKYPNKTYHRLKSQVTNLEKLNITINSNIDIKNMNKIQYLHNRLNKKISENDIKKYKIVLNLNDLLEYNNLDPYKYCKNKDEFNKTKYMLKEFSEHFVGFLSLDNNTVVLRNIDSKHFSNQRYMKYRIDKKLNNHFMYVIDIPIDIMSKNPIINISEGTFDIIGVKLRYFQKENNSTIFAAVGGSFQSYKRAIIEIIKMTGFFDAKINIFADNDHTFNINDFRYNFRDLSKSLGGIYVYRNKLGKDFGDMKEQIKLEKFIV